MQNEKDFIEVNTDSELEGVSGGKSSGAYDKRNPKQGKTHGPIGKIGYIDHGKTTLKSGITTSLNKELLDEDLLDKAVGGEEDDDISQYFIECFDAIEDGKAYDAWNIYHNHFNEINPMDRETLRDMYQNVFHRSIDDDMAPVDLA